MEIKDEQNVITDIFLQSKKDDDELSYQSTSDYVSSDGNIKSAKKKVSDIKHIPIIKNIEKQIPENIKKEEKRIIINKRSILLIKGRR